MPPATKPRRRRVIPQGDRASAMALYYANVPESDWQRDVEETLTRGGWDFIHITDARRQNAEGWPDIFAVHQQRGQVIAAELKTERGTLRERQEHWKALLERVGIPVYVWRPSNVDEMRAVLLGGAS
jgi:hypothetical protein